MFEMNEMVPDTQLQPTNARNAKQPGSARRKSTSVHADPTAKTPPLEHFLTRFMAVFFKAGTTQKTAEHLRVPRNEVFCAGRSQYQDRHSSNRRFHASHVIRIQIQNPTQTALEMTPDLYECIKTRLGNTELVEKWANMWGGIGQSIDELQAPMLKILGMIDFSQDSPRLIESIPETYYKETVSEFYEQLNKIKKNDSYMKSYDATYYSPAIIVKHCIQGYIIIIGIWLEYSGNRFMNTASIKNILSQLNVLMRTANINHLLQLGREGYKSIVQLLSADPKENCVANGNNEVSSNSVFSVWGPVKAMARSVVEQLPWLSTSHVAFTIGWIVLCLLVLCVYIYHCYVTSNLRIIYECLQKVTIVCIKCLCSCLRTWQ